MISKYFFEEKNTNKKVKRVQNMDAYKKYVQELRDLKIKKDKLFE